MAKLGNCPHCGGEVETQGGDFIICWHREWCFQVAAYIKIKDEKTAKCHYCENQSTKTLIWLKDKKQQPARIKLPWCGCDLQVALKKFWHSPYTVVEGRDYETKPLS